jgi:multisubunit Na+/H+ antiporter MnhB subunit
MNISGEDIIYLVICTIGLITAFKWLECVYKYCFNNKYKQTVQKNIHAKVLHEFMCIFIGAPIMVGVSSIIIMIRIFAGTL